MAEKIVKKLDEIAELTNTDFTTVLKAAVELGVFKVK